MSIQFKIVTPERLVVEEEVEQATLPTEDGEVTVLADHIPYIASLRPGEILIKTATGEESLATSGGFVEFHDNTLTILADTAERAEEIDLARAEEAKARAEQLKKERVQTDSEEYARVAALLEKELARLRVARNHHTRHIPSSVINHLRI